MNAGSSSETKYSRRNGILATSANGVGALFCDPQEAAMTLVGPPAAGARFHISRSSRNLT